jgi:hypothetical protein
MVVDKNPNRRTGSALDCGSGRIVGHTSVLPGKRFWGGKLSADYPRNCNGTGGSMTM